MPDRTLRVLRALSRPDEHLRRPREPDRVRAPLRPGAGSASSSPAPGIGDAIDPDAHDLFYIGGGQDRDQALCARDLATVKRDALHAAAGPRRGRVRRLRRAPAARPRLRAWRTSGCPGVGLVDLDTKREDGPRLLGNIAIALDLPGGPARARGLREPRRPDVPRRRAPRRSAACCEGNGNNGADGTEGVRGGAHGTVIGTYMHGPLLPKNTAFADWLTATALGIAPGELRAARRRARGRGACGGGAGRGAGVAPGRTSGIDRRTERPTGLPWQRPQRRQRVDLGVTVGVVGHIRPATPTADPFERPAVGVVVAPRTTGRLPTFPSMPEVRPAAARSGRDDRRRPRRRPLEQRRRHPHPRPRATPRLTGQRRGEQPGRGGRDVGHAPLHPRERRRDHRAIGWPS